jgi:hypothetical protein
VVEALLLADSTSTLVRVVWAAPEPQGSPAPPAVEPIPAGQVELELSGTAGPAAPLVPAPDRPGHFRVALPIRPGAGYVLRGRAAGREIIAATVVPSRFDVAEPARDTITAPAGALPLIPFRWTARGATAFFARGGRLSPLRGHTRDTAGELLLERSPTGSVLTPLTLYAISADAEAYLFDLANPRSNVVGGFGYLGGGIARRKTVRWP